MYIVDDDDDDQVNENDDDKENNEDEESDGDSSTNSGNWLHLNIEYIFCRDFLKIEMLHLLSICWLHS